MGLCPVALNNRSVMLLLVLASVMAAIRADCDACVEGRCYTRKTLARELYIPDQMAIDRKNSILYVHTDSEMNTAFFHEDLTIQLVRRQNFSGLTVDQDTQILYTGDSKNVHKYSQDNTNISTKLSFSNQDKYYLPNLLFYKDCLMYTEKSNTGLYSIIKDEVRQYNSLKKYKISDFVVQVGCDPAKVYFVANDTTYTYNGDKIVTNVLATKSFVLSADKYNNVYFGDATVNVIYKMDNETNQLLEYAAYESGSVDKFVFDNNNNIVFYDSSDGSFSLWKPDLFDSAACTIEAPHSKYRINKSVLEQNGFIR
ncbi:uncharacterized protein [Choristoneura fumiferana]|uniref:uncharacterized protein n=1 Tax=Choristoneura fumiferana TaxID=7141 RepID=UPI003D15D8F5